MSQSEELGVVVEEEEEEDGDVVETKRDTRLQRRLRARKAHRVRAGVTTLVANRANAHTRRAKRAENRGQPSFVLGDTAKKLRGKARKLSDRFHVPVLIIDTKRDGRE